MFKFTGASAAGLQKLRRDIYNVTHKKHAQPQGTTQYQPQINQPQPQSVQTQQTTLPTSSTPTVVNNIYNNIPPMTQVSNYTKRFSSLKTILYATILTIIALALWYMISHGGIGHWLNQGISRVHEFLTAIF